MTDPMKTPEEMQEQVLANLRETLDRYTIGDVDGEQLLRNSVANLFGHVAEMIRRGEVDGPIELRWEPGDDVVRLAWTPKTHIPRVEGIVRLEPLEDPA